MTFLKANALEILLVVVAVVVPLAGLVLALQAFVSGEQRRGGRLVAAAILGMFLYALFIF